jgi:hypothetical protein
MKRHRRKPELERYIDEMRTKQENTVWPNYIANTQGVNEFFLKGSANPTPVQRIGAWLFGLTFILGGFGLMFIAVHRQGSQWPGWVVAVGLWALGGWTCYNGSRKRKIAAHTQSG